LDLLTFLSSPLSGLDKDTARGFASAWGVEHVEKGRRLASQGEPDPMEYIVLDGRAASLISDPEGRAVCVGFHSGPCVVTPNLARTRNGTSLVSIDATTDVLVAQMDNNALIELMLASEPIRDWANGIMQQEQVLKADREWCLAALGGADRLSWFRKAFPNHEELFGHYLIASYLGVSPVTFSRLRGAERDTAFD